MNVSRLKILGFKLIGYADFLTFFNIYIYDEYLSTKNVTVSPRAPKWVHCHNVVGYKKPEFSGLKYPDLPNYVFF